MITRNLPLYLIVLAAAAAAQGTPAAAQPVPPPVTWEAFAKSLASPTSLAFNAVGAGVAQGRDVPWEWDQDAAGYGRRFGSRVGQSAIKGGVMFGVAALRHEDTRYRPSGLHGPLPRLRHAVIGTWWVPRTDGSGDTVALGRISGNFAGGIVSRAWQPPSHRTPWRAMRDVAGGVALDTGLNIVREFWPWKRGRP